MIQNIKAIAEKVFAFISLACFILFPVNSFLLIQHMHEDVG